MDAPSVKSIKPLVYGNDTLLYIVNYAENKGWIILSGDKRTDPILASSDSENIDINNLGGAAVWLDETAGRIYKLKKTVDNDTTSVPYTLWSKIDSLASMNTHVKGVLTRVIDPPYDEINDYEDILIDTKIEVISDKKVGPLTVTKWGQTYPWNECTPFWRNTARRCLTGCVAVAGAQMLYYFHSFKNKPALFYSQGECVGWVFDKNNKNVSFSFSNPTADVWDEMPLRSGGEGTRYVSTLMGYVGWKVNMEYGVEASGARTSDLVGLYREFGIGSEFTGYNPELIRASLDKEIPVNIRAYSERTKKKFLLINVGWNYGGGHSWIIDGYTDKRTRYTYTYQRRPKLKPHDPYSPYNLVQSLKKSSATSKKTPQAMWGTYTRSHTIRSYYWKMNYGWNGFADNGDYSTLEDAVWRSGNGNFEYIKEIIHNFSF